MILSFAHFAEERLFGNEHMVEIILHPCHENYCKECIFNDDVNGVCKNEKYNQNSYKVNCVLHRCIYKKVNKYLESHL